jgi:hypothetical protein
MKVRTLSVLAGVGAPLILSGPAHANFRGITVIEKPNAYTAKTWGIYAIFDTPAGPGQAGDFMSAVAGTPDAPLNITVWQDTEKTIPGLLYQNAYGGDTPPAQSVIDVYPSLAYDTFVTIGIKSTPPADQMMMTPWPGFGPSSLNLTNAAWGVGTGMPQGDPYNPNYVQGNGTVLIAQFSSSLGEYLSGTFLIQWLADKDHDGALDPDAYQDVVSFNTVPTPGVLGLLGLAGVMIARRRRR